MARLLNVQRSGFYAFRKRKDSPRRTANLILLRKIVEIFEENESTYGADKIRKELGRQGIFCGNERVRRLMKIAGIQGKTRQRSVRFCTTNSDHDLPLCENLLNRRFKADRPNQVWVSDITYVRTSQGWLYLCIILDLFSRKIVGWSMREHMQASLVVSAYRMAVRTRKPLRELMFHSDRGVQYASAEFRNELHDFVNQSMSRKGNCLDNAVAESFFANLKVESDRPFATRDQARSSIFQYIEMFYNRKRLHSSLGYVTPEEFERRYAA